MDKKKANAAVDEVDKVYFRIRFDIFGDIKWQVTLLVMVIFLQGRQIKKV